MASQDSHLAAYKRLVRLYPASFRTEYGDDMADLFAAQIADEPSARVWARTVKDLAATVPRRSCQPRSAGSRTDSQSGTAPAASAVRNACRREDGTTTTGCGSRPRAGMTNHPSPVAVAASVSARRAVVRAWAGVTPRAPSVSSRSAAW